MIVSCVQGREMPPEMPPFQGPYDRAILGGGIATETVEEATRDTRKDRCWGCPTL